MCIKKKLEKTIIIIKEKNSIVNIRKLWRERFANEKKNKKKDLIINYLLLFMNNFFFFYLSVGVINIFVYQSIFVSYILLFIALYSLQKIIIDGLLFANPP